MDDSLSLEEQISQKNRWVNRMEPRTTKEQAMGKILSQKNNTLRPNLQNFTANSPFHSRFRNRSVIKG